MSSTHRFPLSSGLTYHALAGSWAGWLSVGAELCEPAFISPRVRGEAHTAPDAAVVPGVKVECHRGGTLPRPLCPPGPIPLEPLLGPNLSSKDSSQSGLKTTLADSLNLNSSKVLCPITVTF